STRRRESVEAARGGFRIGGPDTGRGQLRSVHRPRAADQGILGPARVARSRTTGTSPRRRDRLAARQPADNRSTIRSRQAIEDVTCGPRAAGIAAILGKPFFSKDQMRLRHWNLAGPLGDAVPESLHIADLFSLREGAEPRGLGGDRRLRFSLALARSGGHAITLRTGIFRVNVPGRIQPLSSRGGRGHSALPGSRDWAAAARRAARGCAFPGTLAGRAEASARRSPPTRRGAPSPRDRA